MKHGLVGTTYCGTGMGCSQKQLGLHKAGIRVLKMQAYFLLHAGIPSSRMIL